MLFKCRFLSFLHNTALPSFHVALYVTPRGPLSDTREGLDKQQMHRNYLKMANSVGIRRVLGAARRGHSSPSLSLQKTTYNTASPVFVFESHVPAEKKIPPKHRWGCSAVRTNTGALKGSNCGPERSEERFGWRSLPTRETGGAAASCRQAASVPWPTASCFKIIAHNFKIKEQVFQLTRSNIHAVISSLTVLNTF